MGTKAKTNERIADSYKAYLELRGAGVSHEGAIEHLAAWMHPIAVSQLEKYIRNLPVK